MPSRRSHNKSRLGCDTCRKRRVKCSETGPPCTGCSTRNIECTYNKRDGKPVNPRVCSWRPKPENEPVQPPAACPTNVQSAVAGQVTVRSTPTDSSGRSPFTSHVSEASSTTTVDLENTLELSPRLQELSLMRWWCTHACKSLVRKHTLDIEVWLGPVVDMALKYGWLMDVILSLSATHIAAETNKPTLRSAYASLALEYQSKAVAAARPHLQDVGSENCHALFAFTILNIPISIIVAQLPIGPLEQGRSPVDSIIISAQWIQWLTGLMAKSEEWLRTGCFKLAYEKCDDPSMYDEAYRPATQRLLSLLMQSKYVGREYTKEFDLFSRGIELLETYFLREKNTAIGWPAELGHDFIEKVEAKNEMALLLTMHWGVLLHSLEMWWAAFTGKRLVDQIGRELGGCESALTKESIRWARIQVGLDLDTHYR